MGQGELVEVSGRMTEDQYVEILRDVMIPTVRLHYPDGIKLLVPRQLPRAHLQSGAGVVRGTGLRHLPAMACKKP